MYAYKLTIKIIRNPQIHKFSYLLQKKCLQPTGKPIGVRQGRVFGLKFFFLRLKILTQPTIFDKLGRPNQQIELNLSFLYMRQDQMLFYSKV